MLLLFVMTEILKPNLLDLKGFLLIFLMEQFLLAINEESTE